MNEHSHISVPHKRELHLYLIAFGLSILAGILEVWVSYFISGSVALFSDAIHIASDGLTYGLLVAVVLASSFHPEHELRSTKIGVWLSWTFLLAGDILVFREAILRIFYPHEILGGITLFTATIGLILNWIVVRMMHKTPRGERNIRHYAMSSHALSDLYVSVGVIASSIIVIVTGWRAADWIMALTVAFYLFALLFVLTKKIVQGKWELGHEHTHVHEH